MILSKHVVVTDYVSSVLITGERIFSRFNGVADATATVYIASY